MRYIRTFRNARGESLGLFDAIVIVLSTSQTSEGVLPDHDHDDDERLNKTLHRKMSSRTRQVGDVKFVFSCFDNIETSVWFVLQRSITVSHPNEIPSSMIRSSYSRTSDTSSAYSGSDVMQSSTNGEDSLMNNPNETDDESEESSEVRRRTRKRNFPFILSNSLQHSFPIHDHIRESLMKDAQERTDDDITAILEFLVHFPVSSNERTNDFGFDSQWRIDLGFCGFDPSCSTRIVQSFGLRSGGTSANGRDERRRTLRFVVSDHQRHGRWRNARRTFDSNVGRWTKFRLWTDVGSVLPSRDHENPCGRLSIRRRRTERLLRDFESSRSFGVRRSNRSSFRLVFQGEKNIRKIEENGKVVLIKEIRVDDDEPRQPREIVLKVRSMRKMPSTWELFRLHLSKLSRHSFSLRQLWRNYWICSSMIVRRSMIRRSFKIFSSPIALFSPIPLESPRNCSTPSTSRLTSLSRNISRVSFSPGWIIITMISNPTRDWANFSRLSTIFYKITKPT